jgi:hypothetical protein
LKFVKADVVVLAVVIVESVATEIDRVGPPQTARPARPGTTPGRRAAALHVRYAGRNFLITCDKVIGPRTIVVRPPGPLIGLIPFYSENRRGCQWGTRRDGV